MAERIAVAMSGGVDSSVAAALLKQQGYEVVGLTMQLWPREAEGEACPGTRGCCGLEAIEDARRVAQALGIRHYVLDLRESFQRAVIDPFCDSYLEGRTPNPCILCNTHVKYRELLRRAEAIGATRLATGHYVRLASEAGRWVLRRAVDRRKDQSYALYDLAQEQLAKALFPLGEMTKTQVRAEAARLGLPVAEKAESQQICFVSDQGYGEYLDRLRPGAGRPGPVVDQSGRHVGVHRGIPYYTVGQRHGLGIAHPRPLYVVAVETAANRLVVGEEAALEAQGLVMSRLNWVSLTGLPAEGLALEAKIRYAAAPEPCVARPEGERVRVEFLRAVRAVTPGQAAVCYDGEAVAFGGVIEAPVPLRE